MSKKDKEINAAIDKSMMSLHVGYGGDACAALGKRKRNRMAREE